MSKKGIKNFIGNTGYVCSKCGKIVIEGKTHENQEGICEDCLIAELKQQLAEKERQLNISEELLIKQEKEYDEQLEKQAKIHYRHLKEKDQDKILFALEQLEKVKEFVNEIYGEYSASITTNFIDNQINELKGKVEDDTNKQ